MLSDQHFYIILVFPNIHLVFKNLTMNYCNLFIAYLHFLINFYGEIYLFIGVPIIYLGTRLVIVITFYLFSFDKIIEIKNDRQNKQIISCVVFQFVEFKHT